MGEGALCATEPEWQVTVALTDRDVLAQSRGLNLQLTLTGCLFL